MKKHLSMIGLVMAVFLMSCTTMQNPKDKTNLTAAEFAAKIKELPDAPILDVRTPDEFSKGHLENALNIDWNSDDFDAQIAKLDKNKPVFVYCLSGGRSGAAAAKMRSDGFKKVYEMSGGIMKWRAAGLPETTGNKPKKTGMTRPQFNELLNSEKIVLIDFYADWCGPCKKMKPYLEEISVEMADKVVVVRINADDHQELCKDLKIDALPVLQIYKNQVMTWSNVGFISKEDVVKQLNIS